MGEDLIRFAGSGVCRGSQRRAKGEQGRLILGARQVTQSLGAFQSEQSAKLITGYAYGVGRICREREVGADELLPIHRSGGMGFYEQLQGVG